MKVPTPQELLVKEAHSNALRKAYMLALECKTLEEFFTKLKALIEAQ